MTHEQPQTTLTYAPNVLIVGHTGTGKSTSLEKLPQDETTFLIETELKSLPFKHKFPKVATCETTSAFDEAIAKALNDPIVKIIAIDSITKHLDRCLQYSRHAFKGYDIWTKYGQLGFALLKSLHHKDKIIIATSLPDTIEEEVTDGGSVGVAKKVAAAHLMGNELKGKIDKEFTIVAHTRLVKVAGSPLSGFKFIIKPDGLTTAKTPKQMFPTMKDGLIDNDVMLILNELSKIS